MANLLTEAGSNRILTLDLHAGQIQGFFDIPVDNLYAAPGIVPDIRAMLGDSNLTIVSPDVGGVFRARQIAQRLDADLAIVDKRRERAGVSEVLNIIGDVSGRRCIIVDDIVDSGGTLCNAATALLEAGACGVDAYIVHGVLSGSAVERIDASEIASMTITDSIEPTPEILASQTLRVITVAPLMASAVQRISEESSVSSLFD